MWHAVTCDTKSVEFESNVKNDSTVLLVDLGEKQNADISFTWTRKTLPDFATPFYFVGGLLAVGAVLTASVFAMPPHRRRHRMVMGTAGQLDEHTDQQAEEPVEEVSIREALTGSMSSLAAAFKPSKRGGRRHAAAAGEDVEQSTVIDPSARNLVADAAGAAADDDDMSVGEETSVISADELQAYFARLAQESDESFGIAEDGDTADTGTRRRRYGRVPLDAVGALVFEVWEHGCEFSLFALSVRVHNLYDEFERIYLPDMGEFIQPLPVIESCDNLKHFCFLFRC